MQDDLSEDDDNVEFITPAIVKAGWDEATQISRQVSDPLFVPSASRRSKDKASDVAFRNRTPQRSGRRQL